MRTFRVFLSCPDTKEEKIFNTKHFDFAEAARFAYSKKKVLFDQTKKTWLVSAISDVGFSLDMATPLS